MSRTQKDAAKALAAKPGYEVGYGKPPKETRFKPGQSGNPGGRPKGAKNKRPGMHEERMKDIILDEAYREITVRDGDRTVTIPMVQAVMRSMAVEAAKGQHRAQRLFAELPASTESSRRLLHETYLNAALDYKIAWDKELRRREALGITDLPEPIPHPDHIKIDARAGTVRVIGPMTADEKQEYDELVRQKAILKEAIPELIEALETEEDEEERADLEESIRRGQETLALITRGIPDRRVERRVIFPPPTVHAMCQSTTWDLRSTSVTVIQTSTTGGCRKAAM